LETALTFMKAAEANEPSLAVLVLALLERLERKEEVESYADGIIKNVNANPTALYLAAGALLLLSFRAEFKAARSILSRAIKTMKLALANYLALRPEQREPPNIDGDMALALGIGLERMGETAAAIGVY